MSKSYEANQLRVFLDMYEQVIVYLCSVGTPVIRLL